MSLDISQIVITIAVVCIILWRISYGANSGLIAEAAGLIAVLAAFASVYFVMGITENVTQKSFGGIIPKIGYLIVAFCVYRLMTGIGESLRKMKEIPVLGRFDKILGAVLGLFEALAILYLVEYVTDIKLLTSLQGAWTLLSGKIRNDFWKSFIK
ncbi:MAG: CvpA family protein [Butyrivibrio sp.]|jgi:membrane protein required for colicin V production|uniref:CvpA family protein n=1 Tax=Butyrivibrio sp. LB2008 TaxID=1408305 RepID=UPI00047994EF|nr:CvpA family protein [Butyrivibrio sp. LB2008]MEE3494126.1 CvpA family protein [Butyrivibrio sp.]